MCRMILHPVILKAYQRLLDEEEKRVMEHTYRIVVEGTYREIFHVVAKSEEEARRKYEEKPETYEANSFMEVIDSSIVGVEPPRSETV